MPTSPVVPMVDLALELEQRQSLHLLSWSVTPSCGASRFPRWPAENVPQSLAVRRWQARCRRRPSLLPQRLPWPAPQVGAGDDRGDAVLRNHPREGAPAQWLRLWGTRPLNSWAALTPVAKSIPAKGSPIVRSALTSSLLAFLLPWRPSPGLTAFGIRS